MPRHNRLTHNTGTTKPAGGNTRRSARPRSRVARAFRLEAHGGVSMLVANEITAELSAAGDDEQWQAQDGPGLTRAPAMSAEEAWKQLRLARYRVPAPEVMDVYCAPTESYNDFLMSIALVTEELSSFSALPQLGYVVRPQVLHPTFRSFGKHFLEY